MTATTFTSESKPLSIVHALAPGMAGGLESVVRTLAQGHHRRGHRVGVISVIEVGQPEPTLHSSLRSGGVEIFSIALPARAYLRERAAYRDCFAQLRPDVIHTHGYRSDILAGGVARRMKLPRVTTVHGFTGGDRKNRIYEFFQVRAFQKFDSVVAVSPPLAALLESRGVPPDRLRTIPNAFDLSQPMLSREESRRVLRLPPDQVVVGWVGRLSREKGLDILIEALPSLADLPLCVCVLGSGGQQEELRGLAQRLGVLDRIRWQGLVPDAGRLYRAFDAYVLSSRTEGTPISLFEAMAAKAPIVAAKVGGVPHVISDGEARLVTSESPAELAAAIRETLTDRDSAVHRAVLARRRLEQSYALEPWLDSYEQLYRAVISSSVS